VLWIHQILAAGGDTLNRYSAAITAIGTLAIAAFTFTLWCSTNRLWKTSEKQMAFVRQSADAALLTAQVSKAAIRAIITVKNFTGSISVAGDIVEGYSVPSVKGYGVTANIENVGNSHAVCTCVTSCRLLDVNEELGVFDPPQDALQQAIVGPGGKIAPPMPVGIDIATSMRIWREEARFFYYCRVNYRDIFNEPHHVECCVRIGFRGDPSIYTKTVHPEFITYVPWGPQNTAS
jgi:hypothetical protein